MRRRPRGRRRSVDRGAHRPAIEPRKRFIPGADACTERGRQHGRARHRERPDDPAWSQTLACADAPCTGTGRSRASTARAVQSKPAGPHREGEEPKPMMHDREKSDSAIVAGKPANKARVHDRRRSRWSQGRGPRGTRASKARAGHRAGKACHRRWTAYGKPQGKGRRRGSPRSSTTSTSICSGRRSSRSSAMPPPAWTA